MYTTAWDNYCLMEQDRMCWLEDKEPSRWYEEEEEEEGEEEW